MLWEWKEGRTIDLDQLRRYAGATRADLVERVFLSPDECRGHDTILLVKAEHANNTIELLDRAGIQFPVVAAFAGRFQTIRGNISSRRLAEILADFPCDWELAPVRFPSAAWSV